MISERWDCRTCGNDEIFDREEILEHLFGKHGIELRGIDIEHWDKCGARRKTKAALDLPMGYLNSFEWKVGDVTLVQSCSGPRNPRRR